MKQLYYRSYRDKNTPKEYFKKVHEIADLIGAMLAAPMGIRDYSTINVIQTKEKFGDAVVYTSLADEDLLERSWYVSAINKHRKDPNYVVPKCPSEKYMVERLKEDILLYSQTYSTIIGLFPEYEKSITSGADHQLLISPTYEKLKLKYKYFLFNDIISFDELANILNLTENLTEGK